MFVGFVIESKGSFEVSAPKLGPLPSSPLSKWSLNCGSWMLMSNAMGMSGFQFRGPHHFARRDLTIISVIYHPNKELKSSLLLGLRIP